MSSLADPPARSTFSADAPGKTRKLPVLSSSVTSSAHSSGEPMEVTPPTSAMTGPAPPVQNSPDSDRTGANTTTNGSAEVGSSNNHGPNQAVGAAAAAQQPKVVQTAFIHKLYKYVCSSFPPVAGCPNRLVEVIMLLTVVNSMLEDPSIQHLISWSGTNDSFVMSPTSEFSKVLASVPPWSSISRTDAKCPF